MNGAGAAAIACVELLKAMGMRPEHVILCDTKGVIYQGRTEGMNQWKSAHAAATKARTLLQALEGADVVFGLSAKGALTQDMVRGMADRPIIFAMANPDPEITPEEARAARPNAIIATGRSDYPNQVNNILGFPYIFRGALDVRASTINDAMKIAAAEALAHLAREDVPDEVHSASAGRRLSFGPEYIIPNAFDPRLISRVPPAVAKAAMDSGVARRPLADLRRYARELSGRLDPTAGALDAIMESVRANPKRVVFAEGEEEKVRARRGGVPQRRLWHAGADRARGPRQGDDGAPRSRPGGRAGDPQRAPVAEEPRSTWSSSTSGCSGAASCSATASAWSTRTATCSPPAWWRPAMRMRW